MTQTELIQELNKVGLVLRSYSDKEWAIGVSRFANTMMGFNPQIEVEEYTGGVNFKTINSRLFTGDEIKSASELVDEFLMTPLSD